MRGSCGARGHVNTTRGLQPPGKTAQLRSAGLDSAAGERKVHEKGQGTVYLRPEVAYRSSSTRFSLSSTDLIWSPGNGYMLHAAFATFDIDLDLALSRPARDVPITQHKKSPSYTGRKYLQALSEARYSALWEKQRNGNQHIKYSINRPSCDTSTPCSHSSHSLLFLHRLPSYQK
ncbi:hypothetical protein VTH06DRAFT_4733 [Thermothelomyces fergusii]